MSTKNHQREKQREDSNKDPKSGPDTERSGGGERATDLGCVQQTTCGKGQHMGKHHAILQHHRGEWQSRFGAPDGPTRRDHQIHKRIRYCEAQNSPRFRPGNLS